MNDFDETAEEFQETWDEWYEEYQIGEFIEYSEENWEKVQSMDPRYIWTNHSTCEDEQVTNGAHVYTNSCCWETFGWYVAGKPWEGDLENHFEQVQASANLPCENCNPGGEIEESEYDPECEDCEGTGYVNHFFD